MTESFTNETNTHRVILIGSKAKSPSSIEMMSTKNEESIANNKDVGGFNASLKTLAIFEYKTHI